MDSLAVRLPKTMAEGCGIKADTPIEIVREENTIIKAMAKKHSLDALLAEITEENVHSEVQTGKPVSREVW